MKNNAAVYYVSEGYSVNGAKLMGRNAAGAGFLKAWHAYANVSPFTAFVPNAKEGEAYRAQLQAEAPEAAKAGEAQLISHGNIRDLAKTGCLFLPGPGLVEYANQRLAAHYRAWSLVGITHTLSSTRALDGIAEAVTAPVAPWDAIICTSSVAQKVIKSVWQNRCDFLREQLGATRFVLPQLPLIPLGVHAKDFEFTPQDKARARAALGVEANTIVVLFAGRLSFHAKAHPLAMYQAVNAAAKAAKAQGIKVRLVEYGKHFNDYIQASFTQAVKEVCADCEYQHIDGRAVPQASAWVAADIFCSLADNIQETFGLTPVEAMAAGLPVVVSDWNGYKDTVIDGEQGYLIPTRTLPAGELPNLAVAHAMGTLNYDQFIGQQAMLTSVDIPAATHALQALIENPALRERMGAAGKARVAQHYEWRVLIAQYQALFAQLAQMRTEEKLSFTPPSAKAWAAANDPTEIFDSYPTHTIHRAALLSVSQTNSLEKLAHFLQLSMVNYADKSLIPPDLAKRVLQILHAQGANKLQNISDQTGAPIRSAMRVALFLEKLGLIEIKN